MPSKIRIGKRINKSLDNTKSKLNKSLDNTESKIKKKIIKTMDNTSLKKQLPNNLNVVKEIITGRDNYPTKVLKILKQYGSIPIVGFNIKRTPVSKTLITSLSLLSKGEFNQRLKNSQYDQLFHLYLEVILQSGKKLLIEKNAVINMVPSSKRPGEEIRQITSFPKNLTLDIIMEKTKASMGTNFFTYSANNNNCQDFIVSIMRSNKIGNLQDITFVKQDTKFLFKNLDNTRKTSNTLTTIGNRLDVVKNII
jgi:hypothetical protein